MKKSICFNGAKAKAFIFTAFVVISVFSTAANAKYVNSSNNVQETYVPQDYNAPIVNDTVEMDDNNFFYKSNVIIDVGETGYPVYVRAALIVTWQDEKGNVYGQQPFEDIDYTFEYNTDDWEFYNGYYYYKDIVQSEGKTNPLIKSSQKLKQLNNSPVDGLILHAEVAAETIQSAGTTENGNIAAVIDAWDHMPKREDQ